MTWAKRAIMVLITVLLLALTVRVVGARALLEGWTVLNIWTIAAAVACGFVMTGAQALRWKLLLELNGTQILWRTALADCYTSSLLNMVLPGGLGGDLARIAVYRHTGRRKWWSPLTAVGAERLSATALLFAAAAGTLCGISTPLAASAAAISATAFLGSLLGMGGLGWRHGLLVWSSSAVGMLALFGLFLITMSALGGPVVPVLAVVGLAAMSIPIGVGGWGVRELAVSLVAGGVSVSMESAATVATGYGLLAMVSTLPGLFTVWTAARTRKPPAEAQLPQSEHRQPD